MTNIKAASQDIEKKLANVALAEVKPETRVVLMADTNHFRATETVGTVFGEKFWDEIKKTGKTPVLATEMVFPEFQPILDALRDGKIDKKDFLDTFCNESSGQITSEENKFIMGRMADLITSGVRVAGINNAMGMGGKTHQESMALGVEIELEFMSFWKDNKEAFHSDPNALAHRLMDEGIAKIDQMGPLQKKEFTEDMEKIQGMMAAGKTVSKQEIKWLHYDLQPKANQGLALNAELEKTSINFDVDNRISKDEEVVRSIQKEASDPNALIVVSYGAAHMPGFYNQLKAVGLAPTNPIVPFMGEDHFKCLKPDDPTCAYIGGIKGQMKQDIEGMFQGVPHVKIPNIYEMR